MNEKKRLIKNTGIIAIGNLSTKLVSFFLLPLYTAILTTEEYGIVDYLISIAAFIVPFTTMLMDESVFRFLIDCKTEFEKKKTISQAFFVYLFGELVFVTITIPLAVVLRNVNIVFLIFYVTGSGLVVIVSALMRGLGRTDQYAIFNFVLSLAKIMLNILFIAVFRWGVSGLMLASTISMFVITLFYSIKLKLWKNISPSVINKDSIKSMISYSLPLIPNKVSWTIINLSDRLIIMNFLGSSFSGLYAIAYKFPNLMDTVYGFFYQSWKESSARVLDSDDTEGFYNEVYDKLRRFMFSVVLLLVAFMPLAFKIMINERYSAALVFVPILILGTYYENMSGFYGGIFTAYKDTKIMGTTTIVAAIVNLLVHFSLVRFCGLYAAAISTLVSTFVVYAYRKLKSRKYVKIRRCIKFDLVSYIVLLGIIVLFYLDNIYFMIASMVVAIIFAVVVNLDLIKSVLSSVIKIRCKKVD